MTMSRTLALQAVLGLAGVVALGFAKAQSPARNPGTAQSIIRPDGSAISAGEFDAKVSNLISAAHVTGAAIAVFHDSRIGYMKAYGERDVEQSLPLTLDSVMTSASLNKAAFATVVMKLVHEGVLSLDKPVYRYLPKPLEEYPTFSDLKGDDRYKKITLRMLLSHTAGFPNWREGQKLTINFTPGARYAYSGEGIELAQLVVETVTHKSAAVLMKTKLFDPLGMTRTSEVWEPRFEDNFANGYDEYGRSLGPERRSKPIVAGSMQTSPRDYAMFLSALMQGKALDGKTRAEMLRPQVAIHSVHEFPSLSSDSTDANDAIHLSYGLGWGVYDGPYGRAFFKEGHDEGWRHLALCFENVSGVLIMTNSSNGEGIFKPLIEQLIGNTGFPFIWENYTPYTELAPLPPLRKHKTVALTLQELQHVTGRYSLSAGVSISVMLDGRTLYIQENDEAKQELKPESPSDFYSVSSDDEYSFRPADGDHAIEMILHVDGKDYMLKRQ